MDFAPDYSIYEKKERAIIEALSEMEEELGENYVQKKRDEHLYQLYQWADTIRKKKIESFTIKELVGKKNQDSLCRQLLDSLMKKGVLKCDNNGYYWSDGFRMAENVVGEIPEWMKNALEEFLEEYKYLELMLQKFATYNGVVWEGVREFLCFVDENSERQIPGSILKHIDEICGVYDDLADGELKVEDVTEEYKRYPQEIRQMKAKIAPYLLAYTKVLDGNRYGVVDFKEAIPDERIGGFEYDIVLKNENMKRILLVDCKYYKDLVAGTKSTLQRTLGNFSRTNSGYLNQQFMIVFMTDGIEKSQRKVFDDYCKNAMGSVSLNVTYCLIALNNFETDMNVLMGDWR